MRRHHLLLAAPLLLGPVLAGPAPGAGAQEGGRQGWWTAASVGGVLPGAAVAPDVPPDGLLVQGGPSDDAPVAVAALVVPIRPGSDARTITLQVATAGASLPGSVLVACRLLAPDFAPAQGGPIGAAPPRDCVEGEAATVGADGTSYTFDARPLVTGDAVALVVAPGSPSTRVTLAGTTGATVRVATPRPTVPPAAAAPAAAPPAIADPPTSLAAGGGDPFTRPASGPAGAAPGLDAAAAVAGPSAAAVAPAPFRPAAFGVALPPATNRAAVVLLLAGLGVAGYAWSRAGRNLSFR